MARLSFDELVQQTTDKYSIRFLQKQGLFTPDHDGLYDSKWIDVYKEARAYMKAGLERISAYCEAMNDVFGRYPADWYEG